MHVFEFDKVYNNEMFYFTSFTSICRSIEVVIKINY